ncbi:hypothetical protein [Pelagicoccus sp. SDUM812002]|uniref:hypothetical protein n=1 Tax=Pelagicoccus sp. SDUM812002 TaxID=3041266 RepID=UPI00280F45E6|nr:hypothetical protein [Pelagicoccus sp. SDUM812002]MDQ8185474.1 hypothetical protein [Pelagicoccus sp. SDUM812002]
MKAVLKRFLFSILVPPMVGSTYFFAITLIGAIGVENVTQSLLFLPIIYLYAFAYCFLPGSAYFAIHELARVKGFAPLENLPRFLAIGAITGTVSGLAITSVLGFQSWVYFLPIGILAGTITSFLKILVHRAKPD